MDHDTFGKSPGSSKPGSSTVSGAAAPSADQVKQQAQQTVHQAQDAASHVAGQAHEAVSQVAGQAQEAASKAAGQVQDELLSRIAEQKDKLAEGVGTIGETLRQTSHTLRGQGQDVIGEYVDSAADQAERVSRYLTTRDVEQLGREAGQFARSRPTLFLGSAFVVGLMAARFFKSTRHPQPPEHSQVQGGSRASGSLASGVTASSGSPGPAFSGPVAPTRDYSGPATPAVTASGSTLSGSSVAGATGPRTATPGSTTSGSKHAGEKDLSSYIGEHNAAEVGTSHDA